MAAPVTRAYRAVLAEHRDKLNRLVDRRGAAALRNLYDRAQQDMVRKIERMVPGARTTYTSHLHRLVLGQVQQGQALVAQRLAGEIGDLSREAQVESLRGLAPMLGRLDPQFAGIEAVLPIEEASRFAGIIDARRTSLLTQHRTSVARYGASLITGMESQLSLALATNETVDQALRRVQDVAQNEWWQAERIARTETAWAFNATHRDAIAAAADVVPDLMLRWSEHCDDMTGKPLDDRVGVDSIAMNGQVADPDGMFTMPPTAPVPDAKGNTVVDAALVGQTWTHPPDRPNDRAVLAPWRSGWGIPGWLWQGGRRVPVHARAQADATPRAPRDAGDRGDDALVQVQQAAPGAPGVLIPQPPQFTVGHAQTYLDLRASGKHAAARRAFADLADAAEFHPAPAVLADQLQQVASGHHGSAVDHLVVDLRRKAKGEKGFRVLGQQLPKAYRQRGQ